MEETAQRRARSAGTSFDATTGCTVGFIGLGNMGAALAANVVGSGLAVMAHDARDPVPAPAGATVVAGVGEVARRSDVVVLSLPDGAASEQVCREIIASEIISAGRRATHVVDTSTIGVEAARRVAALLADGGVGYVDAPVSGGVAGAMARTLTVMYAADDEACARVEPVLAALSDRRMRVGDRPGLAQAMKLANNFLAATALAATSEAIAFGRSVGLDMATMLEVLGASSGTNSAVTDKFPRQVLTGRYAAGVANSLMCKDVRLYRSAVEDRGTAAAVGSVVTAMWERFAQAEPGVDFTRIFAYIEGS